MHEELEDDDDDDDDDDDTLDKIPLPGRSKKKPPPDEGKLETRATDEIVKEAEAWQQAPNPDPAPAPPGPIPVVPPAKFPQPTKAPAPVPDYTPTPIPQLFPQPALAEAPFKAGNSYQPAAVLAPLMQQSFEALYKAGNTKTALAPKTLAEGLVKAPTATPTTPTPFYYGKGPEVGLKPVAASVETALAKTIYTYKPITQPSELSTFIKNIKPYVKPAVIGATAAGAAGAGGFFFNWAARLKSMSGGF